MKHGSLISNKNKEIVIKSPNEPIDNVLIYDFSGKQIYKNINVANNENKITNLISSQQVLFVKVVLQDGKSMAKKIIY